MNTPRPITPKDPPLPPAAQGARQKKLIEDAAFNAATYARVCITEHAAIVAAEDYIRRLLEDLAPPVATAAGGKETLSSVLPRMDAGSIPPAVSGETSRHSSTPRTDAADNFTSMTGHLTVCISGGEYVKADFARQLERELNAAREEVAFFKQYAGSQIVMSDFQTADQLRTAYNGALEEWRKCEAQLKDMTDQFFAVSRELGEANAALSQAYEANNAIVMAFPVELPVPGPREASALAVISKVNVVIAAALRTSRSTDGGKEDAK